MHTATLHRKYRGVLRGKMRRVARDLRALLRYDATHDFEKRVFYNLITPGVSTMAGILATYLEVQVETQV